jgi:hypothetical protein
MARAERLAIQADLAWIGRYNGVISGDAGERMVRAIKEFQKEQGGKPTGVLNPRERAVLAETARRRRDDVGWKIVTVIGTGAQLGIPIRLVPLQVTDATGTRWNSPSGTIQIQLSSRKEASPTAARLAERERREPAGRKIKYSLIKPDFFILSGLQGLKKVYVRGTFKGDEVRILTVLYNQATENIVDPAVIAMSSALIPFPANSDPPPRRTVEYGTGVVVAEDGAIVADRLITDGCFAITIAGFGNADLVAVDRDHDLALLRIYGARGLKPIPMSAGTMAKNSVELTGISDPQSQGGGHAASSVKVSVTPVSSKDLVLSPPPALGFSGAVALDGDGKFAGVALLKPANVVGPAAPAPPVQSVLVSADSVRDFLKINGVNASGPSSDAKASVVRVICARK